MITIFNRKEVLTTFSMGDYANAKSILSEHRIRYATRSVSMSGGGSFGRESHVMGSFGENLDYAYQYYLYVHKRDYEEAATLLAGQLRR